MIELLPTDSARVVALRIDRKIETSDFERIVTAVEQVLESQPKVRLLVEIERLEGISLDAFMKDLQFGLRHWRDVERKAVVSDRRWHETLAALANRLFPGIEIRHFPAGQREEALQWLDS